MFAKLKQAFRVFWRKFIGDQPPMLHVMLDIETLGTRAGCKVLSIGAVIMTPQGPGREFYTTVSRDSQNRYGLVEDRETVEWWARQSPQARAAVFGP